MDPILAYATQIAALTASVLMIVLISLIIVDWKAGYVPRQYNKLLIQRKYCSAVFSLHKTLEE